MLHNYRRFLSLYLVVFITAFFLVFCQPASESEIGTLKTQMADLKDKVDSLEKHIELLENTIKKVIISTTAHNAQYLNIEDAKSNTWKNPQLLTKSSILLSWNSTDIMEVHVHDAGSLILKEVHAPGDLINLPANKILELKIWLPRNPSPLKTLWVKTP